MKVRELIHALIDCDLEAEVKPYFLIDAEYLDGGVSQHEIYGDITEVDNQCTENNIVYINADY